MPQRIQRSRRYGYLLPDGTPYEGRPVYVGRPGKWGNPFLMSPVAASFPSLSEEQVAQFVVNDFRVLVETGHGRAARGALMSSPEHEDVTYPSVAEIRAELVGRDLACWCRADRPCHADVLLELSNQEQE